MHLSNRRPSTEGSTGVFRDFKPSFGLTGQNRQGRNEWSARKNSGRREGSKVTTLV